MESQQHTATGVGTNLDKSSSLAECRVGASFARITEPYDHFFLGKTTDGRLRSTCHSPQQDARPAEMALVRHLKNMDVI